MNNIPGCRKRDLRVGEKKNWNMKNKSGNFWDLQGYQDRKWFGTVTIGLILLISLYILLHFFINKNGFEFAKLDEKQIQQINKIYFNDSVNINKVKPTEKKVTDTNKTKPTTPIKILTTEDSLRIKDSLSKISVSLSKKPDSCNCDTLKKYERALVYLKSEFQKIDEDQIKGFKEYLQCANPLEATSFLSNLRLRVVSYFWLKGPSAYFEIIFWTLFGVLCNILFSLGIVTRSRTNNPEDPSTYFDSSEIPSQVAKLFYAPLCTLIIVFGYNYFTSQSLADISSSKGVIVFAFVGGFYSERLIAFLDRLKDVLLPNSGKADVPETKQAALRNAVIQLIKPIPLPTDAIDPFATVDLSTAMVVLTYLQTSEKIIVKNIDKSQPSLFIADFIKPGLYKAEVTINTKDAEGKDLVLKGNKDFEMKAVDLFITVQLNTALS